MYLVAVTCRLRKHQAVSTMKHEQQLELHTRLYENYTVNNTFTIMRLKHYKTEENDVK
jgi:hypothetical protein